MGIEMFFGVAVVAALVGASASLLGIVLKDYWFSRSFERWKQRYALEQIYQRIRTPLSLAANELVRRLDEIIKNYPTVYLSQSVLASTPEKQLQNSIDDPYFRRHKLLSTCYRLSAFLGWIELFRQDVTFLNPSSTRHTQALSQAIEAIRCDLADGQINNADDWLEWRDTLVFREELRAIGESMLCEYGSIRTVMGFCRFSSQLESSEKNPVKRWSPVVLNFLIDQQAGGKDFRLVRLRRLVIHLNELEAPLGQRHQMKLSFPEKMVRCVSLRTRRRIRKLRKFSSRIYKASPGATSPYFAPARPAIATSRTKQPRCRRRSPRRLRRDRELRSRY